MIASTPSAGEADPAAKDPGPLATLDWRNRSYVITLRGEAPLRFEVVDGEGRLTNAAGGAESLQISANPGPVYGDLTGDGVAEAVVRATHFREGAGTLDVVLVFAAQAGDAVQIGAVAEGVRADGDILGVAVDEGRLLVERFIETQLVMDGDPETTVQHETWRWDADHLVEDVSARRRETTH